MAAGLILAGIIIAMLWAEDIQKGNEDASHKRLIHEQPYGCIPFIIAIILIGIGIYLAL